MRNVIYNATPLNNTFIIDDSTDSKQSTDGKINMFIVKSNHVKTICIDRVIK